jgi:hypothetical protein
MKPPVKDSGIIAICFLSIFCVNCNSPLPDQQVISLEGEYLCISLKHYFAEAIRLLNAGEPLPEDFESLYGMSWIDGFIADGDNNDVIIIGKSIATRPTYHFEDLVVSYQNVFDSLNAPYCSLDPVPENLLAYRRCFNRNDDDHYTTVTRCQEALGGQKVVVGGVPRNSRHAWTMIFADYEMKKLSQGLISDPSIRSCLDLMEFDSTPYTEYDEEGGAMSRFWFHIKKDDGEKSYPNFAENEGIVMIRECPVVLLTERQVVTESGELMDDPDADDSVSEIFAREFTEKFDELKSRYTLFAELENTYRIQALFSALYFKNVIEEVGLDLTFVSDLSLEGGGGLPETLPGLVNYKIYETTELTETSESIRSRLLLVAGGVDQSFPILIESFFFEPALVRLRRNHLKKRENASDIHWYASLKTSPMFRL